MESADPEAASMQRRELPPDLKSVGVARDFVSEVLSEPNVQPLIDPALVRDVQLAVSELVTNAVTHGSGPTVVVVGYTPDHVHCSVSSDREGDVPVPVGTEAPPSSARSGRGLAIVRAVADQVVATVERATWTIDCDFVRR